MHEHEPTELLEVWCYGWMVLWLYTAVVVQCCGCTMLWLYDAMVVWCCGCTVLWLYDAVVVQCYGCGCVLQVSCRSRPVQEFSWQQPAADGGVRSQGIHGEPLTSILVVVVVVVVVVVAAVVSIIAVCLLLTCFFLSELWGITDRCCIHEKLTCNQCTAGASPEITLFKRYRAVPKSRFLLVIFLRDGWRGQEGGGGGGKKLVRGRGYFCSFSLPLPLSVSRTHACMHILKKASWSV